MINLGERGSVLAGADWRYVPGGRVRHQLRADVAYCGLDWLAHLWRGTGNQDEYERLADLPPCRNCVKHGAIDTKV